MAPGNLWTLYVPLNDGLMVPASPPVIRCFMVTRQKRVVLRNLLSAGPTDREIVEATVAFVNGATIVIDDVPDSLKHLRLEAAPMLPAERQVAEDSLRVLQGLIYGATDSSPEADSGIAADDEAALQARYRLVYRKFLARLLCDPSAISREFSDKGLMSKLPIDTYLLDRGDGLSIVHHYHLNTFFDVTQIGTAYLLDRTRDYTRKLCQCQLRSCGKFFFEVQPPTGRPQRKYCCKGHMEEAHAQNAGKRMKKFRSKPARKK
jgi:hypothetical protein